MKLLSTTICLILLFSGQTLLADEQHILSSRFIYNLTDHVNWNTKNQINICSYGYDATSMALANIEPNDLSKTDRLYSPNQIKMLNHINFEEINTCDLLYISKDKEKDITKIIDLSQNNKIITISSLENFNDKGGILEFKISRQKIKIKINHTALNQTNIKLSPIILMAVHPTYRPKNLANK